MRGVEIVNWKAEKQSMTAPRKSDFEVSFLVLGAARSRTGLVGGSGQGSINERQSGVDVKRTLPTALHHLHVAQVQGGVEPEGLIFIAGKQIWRQHAGTCDRFNFRAHRVQSGRAYAPVKLIRRVRDIVEIMAVRRLADKGVHGSDGAHRLIWPALAAPA
jgi:hypothetical protein